MGRERHNGGGTGHWLLGWGQKKSSSGPHLALGDPVQGTEPDGLWWLFHLLIHFYYSFIVKILISCYYQASQLTNVATINSVQTNIKTIEIRAS